jgi:ABC-type nitrate/sulfonate/bicarbonate transport system ATPase subunit
MALVIENLSFSYENKVILKNFSLQLKKGEIGSLIGASGSGKSTLFKILTGLESLQEGQITLLDFPKFNGKYIAYMMQQDLLLPWRTVLDNILLSMELGKHSLDRSSRVEEACRLLKEVGLNHCTNMYPDELSGGMRQRVSLARALLQRRPILLLDEPFGALDVGLREQMYQLLRQIREKYQTTILMVTHDFRDALSLSDRLFLLAEGKIYKEWEITSHTREDFRHMGLIQQELQHLLIYYAEYSKHAFKL